MIFPAGGLEFPTVETVFVRFGAFETVLLNLFGKIQKYLFSSLWRHDAFVFGQRFRIIFGLEFNI
jgi:hypothetical protein